jgi:hypothetical protein
MLDEFASRYRLTVSGSAEERRLRYETKKIGVNAQTDSSLVSLDFFQR